jgi:hypothetical protein
MSSDAVATITRRAFPALRISPSTLERLAAIALECGCARCQSTALIAWLAAQQLHRAHAPALALCEVERIATESSAHAQLRELLAGAAVNTLRAARSHPDEALSEQARDERMEQTRRECERIRHERSRRPARKAQSPPATCSRRALLLCFPARVRA